MYIIAQLTKQTHRSSRANSERHIIYIWYEPFYQFLLYRTPWRKSLRAPQSHLCIKSLHSILKKSFELSCGDLVVEALDKYMEKNRHTSWKLIGYH